MEVARVTMTDAWQRLLAVRAFRFSVRSNDRTSGWNGTGAGTVTIAVIDSSTVTFTERGRWDFGKQLNFSNCYRWTLAEDAGIIRLEHLRFGPGKPVFLLDLAAIDASTLESISPHHCGADFYRASVKLGRDALYLHWRIKGLKKDAEIDCIYTW
ncbi:MAG: DUF6314 family protein [Planctomycetota bacterium]